MKTPRHTTATSARFDPQRIEAQKARDALVDQVEVFTLELEKMLELYIPYLPTQKIVKELKKRGFGVYPLELPFASRPKPE